MRFEQHVPVELMGGNSGIKIMGHLVRLRMDPHNDDFMFKSPFGIVTAVHTMIFDDIHVEELYPGRAAVYCAMARFPDDRLRIEAQPRYNPSPEESADAHALFKLWTKDRATLVVLMGDDLRISTSLCEITPAGDDAYMLTDPQSKTIHFVFPEESGQIQIENLESGPSVTLYNRHANSQITMRRAKTDSLKEVEELLGRFPVANRFVH